MTASTVRCCIAGGGPAGLMLGLLLARAGITVRVLEKHSDFLRDFRGDTLHPSTLQVMHELGLLQRLLSLPHQKAFRLNGQFGDTALALADFSTLPVEAPYIAFMPQWDFLNFLTAEARRSPTFQIDMDAEATGLIEADGRITGLTAQLPSGTIDIHAELIVGADGRNSTIRQSAGLTIEAFGAPIDALWFNLPRATTDPEDPMGRFEVGRIFVMLNRGENWQCAYVIPKGSLEAIKARGLDHFHASLAAAAPFLGERARHITSFEALKLLTVRVDRLKQWYRAGLLCIGDAAHAMSPVAGVGINLAIQDAVAAANLLWRPLRTGHVTTEDLAQVQLRREWPARLTQRLQMLIQNRVIAPVLSDTDGAVEPPAVLRFLTTVPFLRRLPARLIGLGLRPEHVQSPAI